MAASHQDKGYYSNSSISKEDWERIFGKHEPSTAPEHLKNPKAKPRLKRDDFANRGPRWV